MTTKTRAELQLRPDGDYDEDVATVQKALNRHRPNTHIIRPKPDRRLVIEGLTNEEMEALVYLFELPGQVPWDDLKYTQPSSPPSA